MKQCPQCGQTYNDGSLNFCLIDGALLVPSGDSEATVVTGGTQSSVPTVSSGLPAQAGGQATQPAVGGPTTAMAGSKKKGGRLLVWLGLVVLLILVGVVALVGSLIYFSGRGERAQVKFPGNVVASPTPRRSLTPKPSPTEASTQEEETPPANDEKDDSNGSGEITPIAWNTSAASFKNDIGMTYTFECPANGTSAAVWGSDIYTADSSICTAAVHAGLISFESGGIVTIEYRPGRQIYGSTARNGVTSYTFGEYPRSFVFKEQKTESEKPKM